MGCENGKERRVDDVVGKKDAGCAVLTVSAQSCHMQARVKLEPSRCAALFLL